MAREGGGGLVPSAKRLADGSHGVAHARHGADLRGKGAAVRGREEGKSSTRTLNGAIMSAMSG